MLLAREEEVRTTGHDRYSIGDGRPCGMGMNVEKTEVMRISRQSFPLPIVIGQKQLEKWNIFNCFGSRITNYARCTLEIKLRIAVAKAAFSKKNLFTSKLDLK